MTFRLHTPNLYRTLGLLLCCAAGNTLALPASTAVRAQLYSQPHAHGQVARFLPADVRLDVKVCTGGADGWCAVTIQGRQGWVPRAELRALGNCAALRRAGLGDLRRGEASYTRQRDRNGNGVGCEQQGD